MSALRIALIASSRYPVNQPFAGGLEAHVWHLAAALRKAGHEVTLFAGHGSDPQLACELIDARPGPISTAARTDISMPAECFMQEHHAYLDLMLRLAGDYAESFDIIHNHSLHYLPVAMASTLSAPVLTTLHTPPTPWLESAIAAGRSPGRFAAVSRFTADSWKRAAGDVDVVHNGVDTDQWRQGPGGHRLIWFGRIVPEKGAHHAIAAARESGMPLVLAGPISDHTYFRERIEPQLGDSVRYLGHLVTDDLAAAVGMSAVALVTPHWDEPYGLVVAEALACGTPVVAYRRGGIPEILTPDCGRLVPADDVAALSVAIGEAKQLARPHARARAVNHCSERRMVDRYVALYNEMYSATTISGTSTAETVPTAATRRVG